MDYVYVNDRGLVALYIEEKVKRESMSMMLQYLVGTTVLSFDVAVSNV